MPKRVAITIAGVVSLGSYEAGVAYELLEAIRLHNEAIDKAKSSKNDDEKIYVDVITGALAGGMTAAMLAQWLMFRGSATIDAAANPLYDAWVTVAPSQTCIENHYRAAPSALPTFLIKQCGKRLN